jgi:hypothetical protein
LSTGNIEFNFGNVAVSSVTLRFSPDINATSTEHNSQFMTISNLTYAQTVPEPGSMLLFTLAGGGVALFRRKQLKLWMAKPGS